MTDELYTTWLWSSGKKVRVKVYQTPALNKLFGSTKAVENTMVGMNGDITKWERETASSCNFMEGTPLRDQTATPLVKATMVAGRVNWLLTLKTLPTSATVMSGAAEAVMVMSTELMSKRKSFNFFNLTVRVTRSTSPTLWPALPTTATGCSAEEDVEGMKE